MAFVGLSKPYIALLKDEATPTYEKGFKCGKAMTLNITPNYNEASLYADNQRAEYEKEFKDGTITLGTDRLPVDAATVLFNHEYDDADKKTTYKTSDSANYVGVGFVVQKVLDGVKSYEATIVYKCKFTEGADDYTTKGESIEFKTPSLEGAISALETGVWKTTQEFDTEANAESFIKTTFAIS